MVRASWGARIAARVAAAGMAMAGCHLLEVTPPPLPVHPVRPYRVASRCVSGPLDWRLVDADGDDHLDIVILCEEELLVASGLNGDTLWRQDLPRPFPGSFAAPRSLETEGRPVVTGDVIIVEYPAEVVSFDAVTGRHLWAKPLHRVEPSLWLRGGCLIVDQRDDGEPAETFSARRGEPCTPPPRPPRRPEPTERLARVRASGGWGGKDSITLERGKEELWTVTCDSACSAERLSGSVLVTGWVDRCIRILEISRGQVTWVLKPQDAGWRVEAIDPYLIAWRPLEPGASPVGRPVLEVFDARSLGMRWRSDPDEPEAVWELTDHCEPTLPDTSGSPLPLTCTSQVDRPCANGIVPRAAASRDDVVIQLERTPCFGDCPSYVISIFADGRVRYEGLSVDGMPDAQLAPGELAELIRQLRYNGFFELCNVTKQEVRHFSSMSIELRDGMRAKRVEAYLGNWLETAALRELGERIDHAVGLDASRLGPDSTSSL